LKGRIEVGLETILLKNKVREWQTPSVLLNISPFKKGRRGKLPLFYWTFSPLKRERKSFFVLSDISPFKGVERQALSILLDIFSFKKDV